MGAEPKEVAGAIDPFKQWPRSRAAKKGVPLWDGYTTLPRIRPARYSLGATGPYHKPYL